MSKRILITPRSFRQMTGTHQDLLRQAGYELVNSPYSRPATATELAELVADKVAIILGLDECSAEVIQQATQLKVISRFGVGVDQVDLVAATRAGVVVTNTPGANALAVAEHAFMLMMAIARQLPQQDRLVRQGEYTPVSGTELYGSALGIVGMGRIGRELATRANSFGMRVYYYDPFVPSDRVTDATALPFLTLLEICDFVSLHSPLTPETHAMMNSQTLSLMKRGAYLINTARGELIDESALYEALRRGHLAGAACDVFTHEPPTDSPLLTLPNFIATPHSASATRQTTLRMGIMASQNALTVLLGQQPLDVVNPDVYIR
jgi:D-3-phosphoglycerate dehydrogenase